MRFYVSLAVRANIICGKALSDCSHVSSVRLLKNSDEN
jgi:hypothetical protein